MASKSISGASALDLKNIQIQAFHAMLTFAAIMGTGVVDMAFIARLGSKELIAVSLVSPLMWLLNSVAMGVGLAVSVFTSKNDASLQIKFYTVLSPALRIVIAIYIIILLINIAYIDQIIFLFTDDEITAKLAKSYFMTWVTGYLIVLLFIVGSSFIRGMQLFKVQARIVVQVAICNILISPILIFGALGYSGFGLIGSVYALLISQTLGFLLCIKNVRHHNQKIQFQLERVMNFPSKPISEPLPAA